MIVQGAYVSYFAYCNMQKYAKYAKQYAPICKIICKIIVQGAYLSYFAYCNMQNMQNMQNNMQNMQNNMHQYAK